MMGLTGMLSDRPLSLGTSLYRHGNEPLGSTPKARNFRGNVAILVDGLSISAAEMFAAAMQDAGRAFIVGETSAGETLPSITVPLPTGATLMYPIANFRTSKGKFLEGVGVTPDRVVRLERQSLLNGKDQQLETAVLLLQEQKPVPPPPPPARIAEYTGRVNAAPPPPPPPMPRAPVTDRDLGTVTITAPPPPKKPEPKVDPKAKELLAKFASQAGGVDAFEAIKSYAKKGRMQLFMMGSHNTFDYSVYRSGTDRFAEVIFSETTGEIKDVRDGKTLRIKTDFGMEQSVPFPIPVTRSEYISSLIRAMKPDEFVRLEYLGIFDRGDGKIHLIDAETAEGDQVALSVDVETGFLVRIDGTTGGTAFGDYRKVGNLMMPYRLTVGNAVDIMLDEILIDLEIDPEVFKHKVNCFDRPN